MKTPPVPFATAIFPLLFLATMRPLPSASLAADWPTYLQNSQRNAVTDEKLIPPLSAAWVHHAAWAPQPAWPPPANQDFWHKAPTLDERATHERAFQVAVAGDTLYYASPANHAVYAVDTASGEVRWKFLAEGPVRLAPTLHHDRVYFGADDGHVYCLDRQGRLLWRFRVSPTDRRLPGNDHLISLWPVRSGVVIDQNVGWVCAGFFPNEGTYRCAFDPDSGRILWRVTGGIYDGYLALNGEQIIAPAGRATPQAFAAKDGAALSLAFPEAAGAYLVAADAHVFYQAGRYTRALALNVGKKPYVRNADLVVCRGGIAYFHGRKDVTAVPLATLLPLHIEKAGYVTALESLNKAAKKLNKTKDAEELQKLQAERAALQPKLDAVDAQLAQTFLWTKPFPSTGPKDPGIVAYSLILAGDVLFAGREGEIAALRAQDGEELWKVHVPGKVYGLAVANGRLFASTDAGAIHCFTTGSVPAAREVNLAVSTAPTTAPAAVAEQVARILARTPERKGYCLVLASVSADWLVELARTTDFHIAATAADAGQAAALRNALDDKGCHGRVAVHQELSQTLPFPPYFATLVVLDSATAASPAEVWRVLQPCAGVAVMADGRPLKPWMKDQALFEGEYDSSGALRRGPLPGAGEWTHQYCTPANGAASYDPYVRGQTTPLWFGEPGPRDMIDRHNRTMSPLFKDGRLFIPANEKIIALNAYNGVRLWDLDVPDSRRVGVLKDAGHMAVAGDTVYIVVQDQCWTVQAASGQRQATLRLPPDNAAAPRSWGYLAVVGDQVLGTAQAAGASFATHTNMCPILEGDFRPVIASRSLFALDRKTGAARWQYQNGPVLNSAIAVADGLVFFLESRNPEALAQNHTGRMRVDTFLKAPCFLVALDLLTGRKKWDQPVALPYQHIVYLQCAPGQVLVMGTANRPVVGSAPPAEKAFYGYHAFQADTGKLLWQNEYPTRFGPDGSHGEQWQHPVILDREAYTKYFACHLEDGTPVRDYGPAAQGNCGTWAASACSVFTRGGGFDLGTLSGIALSGNNRTGCFINIIPAGGILSMPESSAGCTCDYPVQASMALAGSADLAPILYPLDRKFTDRITVSMRPVLQDVTIRYTLDGTDPDERSLVYTKPFELSTTTTVKARLWSPATGPVNVVSATFVRLP